MGNALESKFQASLIQKVKAMLPDAIVMKMDSGYKQGIPDLLILHNNKWATLECKRNQNAPHQPNQDWYVEKMDRMSFSKFVYPENCDTTLHALFDFLTDREGTSK